MELKDKIRKILDKLYYHIHINSKHKKLIQLGLLKTLSRREILIALKGADHIVNRSDYLLPIVFSHVVAFAKAGEKKRMGERKTPIIINTPAIIRGIKYQLSRINFDDILEG